MSRIDQVLEAARTRLRRLAADEVPAALRRGALLVDIRPQAQRTREGEVPESLEALVIERNVLEWRCDPTSDARLSQAVSDDVEWVILCSEGYTSSLAAVALQDLGLHRATDVVGGYRALAAAGGVPLSNTRALGDILYTRYLFAFQVAGLILLVAMVGAIVLTLRHRADVRRQSISAQLARRRAETVEVVKVPLGAGSD